MHSVRGRFAAIASACLVLAVASPAAAQVAPSDEQEVRQLLARLYDARARKDVPAMAALWAPKAAGRITANYPANYVFPYERLALTRFSISRLKQEATSITGRVTAEVTITLTAVDNPRAERWVRNVGFVKEGDAWLLWREVPAAEDLAVEVGRAKSPEEREELLKADTELITEELALALEGQGDRLFSSGNAKGSLAFYQLELKVGEQAQSAAAVSRGHLKVGQVLQLSPAGMAELDERYRGTAMDHFRKALEGFTATADRARMASAEVGMATTAYMKDDLAAREHYQKAVDILETLPDRLVLANAVHGYGNACFMLGDFSAALDAYRRSMSLQEAARSRGGIPALWQAIGRVQKKQGDYDSALESCRKSLTDPGLLDPGTQFGSMLEIADVYRLQGRFDLALDEYNQTLALVQARDDKQGCMRVEADIGNVYMTEQQPAAALGHYQKSVELAQQVRNQDGVARALAGLGSAHFAEMRNDAALDAFSRALAIREAAGDRGNMAWLHAHIGLVLSASDKHEEALLSFQKALDLSHELLDRAAAAVMQALLAAEHADLDHPDQALDLADRAAAAGREIESDDTVARAKVITARVLRTKGDRDGAGRALQEAMAAIESGRARAGDEPRDDFFGDTRGPYREMALLAADTGQEDKVREAIIFAERAHISLLADILTGNRSLITNGLSAEEQEEERQLSRTRRSLGVQADKEQERPKPDPARLGGLKAKLAEVEQQRAAFIEMTYTAHPALKLQRGLFEAGQFPDFSALVDDGKTVVVEFVTGEKQTLALVLAKSAAGIRTAPSTRRAGGYDYETIAADISLIELTRRVRDYRTALRNRDPDIAKPGKELYELLVAPWAHVLAGRTRLVIVPDGPLWSLPFQALQSPDGRYLIQRCAVSYAPSLTALTLVAGSSLAPPSASRGRRVVAVANQQAGSAADRLKLLNAAVNLEAMPNAEQEVRGLAQVYGGSRVRVHAGPAATEDAIRTDAQTASLLHLATFFVPSAASPMRSPIVFSVDKNGRADVVEAWELMRTALPPVTVVSRVHIDRIGGDGTVPVGLSWVFFVAGSKTTVLATWPDDSRAAVLLMLGLHRNLARATAGAGAPGKALRQAILPLLTTKYRHPFYWANYAVIGVG
jgi:CHAT domain-containing protein/tetratricopeptide (TPR) repeat protein